MAEKLTEEERLTKFVESLDTSWCDKKMPRNPHLVSNVELITMGENERQSKEELDKERKLWEMMQHGEDIDDPSMPKYAVMMDPTFHALNRLLQNKMRREQYMKTKEHIEKYLNENEDKWVEIPTCSSTNAPVEAILNMLKEHFNDTIEQLLKQIPNSV